QSDHDPAVGQVNHENENGGQHRVDRGDDDLGADDGGKAVVEFAEARCDFVAINRVEIVRDFVRFAKEIESAVKEKADGADDRDDDKNEGRRGVSGEVGEVAEVARLFFNRCHRGGLEALEVGEGEVEIVVLCPGDRGRNRIIGDLGHGIDGGPNEMAGGVAESGND